jgi:hypothetical protein
VSLSLKVVHRDSAAAGRGISALVGVLVVVVVCVCVFGVEGGGRRG